MPGSEIFSSSSSANRSVAVSVSVRTDVFPFDGFGESVSGGAVSAPGSSDQTQRAFEGRAREHRQTGLARPHPLPAFPNRAISNHA